LSNLNVNKHSWHIYSFDKWLNEFFIPCIEDHHHNEENISFPFWIKLEGIESPKKQYQDHEALLKHLSEIKALSEEILSMVSINVLLPPQSTASLIAKKCDELKALWDSSMQHMFEHLAEEEKFWPAIYEKHGEKITKQDEANIVSAGLKAKGIESEAFKMIFASLVSAMGTTLNKSKNKYGKLSYDLPPWASKELSLDFHNSLPSVPKYLIFPSWLDKYERWCVLLDSINGDVDRLQELFLTNGGCGCVIS
jgi:hemerythrin superfamily protein